MDPMQIYKFIGEIDRIIYQEKLKAPYREQYRRIAEVLNVPVFKHKQLSNTKESPIIGLYEQ